MLITDSPDWSKYSVDQLINILESKDTLLMERKRIRLALAGYINVYPHLKEPFDSLVEEIKSRDIVMDEIIRQRELRILKHRREWKCDPHNVAINSEDITQARKYLNTVEDWGDEYHEERITREDD